MHVSYILKMNADTSTNQYNSPYVQNTDTFNQVQRQAQQITHQYISNDFAFTPSDDYHLTLGQSGYFDKSLSADVNREPVKIHNRSDVLTDYNALYARIQNQFLNTFIPPFSILGINGIRVTDKGFIIIQVKAETTCDQMALGYQTAHRNFQTAYPDANTRLDLAKFYNPEYESNADYHVTVGQLKRDDLRAYNKNNGLDKYEHQYDVDLHNAVDILREKLATYFRITNLSQHQLAFNPTPVFSASYKENGFRYDISSNVINTTVDNNVTLTYDSKQQINENNLVNEGLANYLKRKQLKINRVKRKLISDSIDNKTEYTIIFDTKADKECFCRNIFNDFNINASPSKGVDNSQNEYEKSISLTKPLIDKLIAETKPKTLYVIKENESNEEMVNNEIISEQIRQYSQNAAPIQLNSNYKYSEEPMRFNIFVSFKEASDLVLFNKKYYDEYGAYLSISSDRYLVIDADAAKNFRSQYVANVENSPVTAQPAPAANGDNSPVTAQPAPVIFSNIYNTPMTENNFFVQLAELRRILDDQNDGDDNSSVNEVGERRNRFVA